jgi:hypothetical protein
MILAYGSTRGYDPKQAMALDMYAGRITRMCGLFDYLLTTQVTLVCLIIY